MLTQEQFELIKNKYWVCSFPDKRANAFDWVFSIEKPDIIIHPLMEWRKPTFKDAKIRQEAYDRNPSNFKIMIEKRKRNRFNLCLIK